MSDKQVRINIYIDKDIRDKFKVLTAVEDISMNEVLTCFIIEWVNQREYNLPEVMRN